MVDKTEHGIPPAILKKILDKAKKLNYAVGDIAYRDGAYYAFCNMQNTKDIQQNKGDSRAVITYKNGSLENAPFPPYPID